MRDPLGGLVPVHERDHPPPAKARLCPTCAKPMHFTHYDADRIVLGHLLVDVGLYTSQVLAATLMIALALLAAMLWGVLAMLAVLLFATAPLYLWVARHIEARAVWYCSSCDRHVVGPRLLPWRAP